MAEKFTNNVLVILEVIEPGKASDLRYITIGCTDNATSEFDFASQAIAAFRDNKKYAIGTTFVARKVLKFEDFGSYFKFLETQLSEYLESLRTPQ